jgi:hypothetical protein
VFGAGLAALMLAAAAPAEPVPSLRELPPEPRYGGVQYEVGWPGSEPELRFVFWPHELVSSDERGRFVSRDDVLELQRNGDVTSWRLAPQRLPELELSVRLERSDGVLRIRYAVENLLDETRFVAIAPCLQLPAEFGRAGGWARAKRVFVRSLGGLRWVSDTVQRRGRRLLPTDPDPARSPWSQHFLPRGVPPDPPLLASPLALFGIAAEPVASSWIGASAPGGARHVLAASNAEAGPTFSLLDCLHAGLAVRLGPHQRRQLELRIYFHSGALEPLLARAARELGAERPSLDDDFVAPDAAARELASFESGSEGWRPGSSEEDGDAWFAPTHGRYRLRATLAPGEALVSPWLDARREAGREAWLTLDVGAPEAPTATPLQLALESEAGEVAARSVALSEGKWRRVSIRIPPSAAERLRLRLHADGARTPVALGIDAVSLFTR